MATYSIIARQDSTTAANDELNPTGAPAETIVFTDLGTGDLSLEYNGGAPDPDTWILINNVPTQFTVVVTGVLPSNLNPNRVPISMRGRTVAVIRVVVNGVPREYFFVLGKPPASLDDMNGFGTGAIPLTLEDFDPPPFCLAAGTDIATPAGHQKIESLRAGDSVLTEDGRTVQIAWIGSSRYSQRVAASDPSRRPICIHANAFGAGLPQRDLVVSPQHRIVVEGPYCELLFGSPRVFVIARHLPQSVASSPEPEGDVVYYHLLLDQHEVLLANGLPTESFQPARRMVECLSGQARASLEATLAILGAEAMLTRPDALPTLASHEARVLAGTMTGQGKRFRPAAAALREQHLRA